MGNRYDAEGALGNRDSGRRASGYSETRPGPSAAHVRPPVPRCGGELDQIQFLLGHVSIQTTEQYLGCKQKLRYAVNDKMGIDP
jgi:integrase